AHLERPGQGLAVQGVEPVLHGDRPNAPSPVSGKPNFQVPGPIAGERRPEAPRYRYGALGEGRPIHARANPVQHWVMYTDAMHRTQIYLNAEEVEILRRTEMRSGASRSELIRRAIRTQYGDQTPESRLAALRASAGSWQGRTTTGAEYVERTREDLDERLEQFERQ